MELPSSVSSLVDWLDSLGLIGLGLLTFTEAIIQPIPPETILIPMAVNETSYLGAFLISLVATLTSVCGAIVGYWIGGRAGRPLIERFASERNVTRLDTLTTRYGVAGIFIAAISPIPYKVFGWIAGAGNMDMRMFIFAGLIGRGIRFSAFSFGIVMFGEELLDVLNIWTFTALGIVIGVASLPLLRWWNGLAEPENQPISSD